MEAHAEEASKAVRKAERRLQHALNAPEIDYANLEVLLEKLRVCSGNLSLLTLVLGRSAHDIEARLWSHHVTVKGRFMSWLKSFRNGQGKKRPVEKRKAEKLFIDFTKAGTRFYRAYIGRLPANFKDIPRVLAVAQQLDQVGLTGQPLVEADQKLQRILEESCKLSIIRLGDLARWKESEEQKHNWAPARGYYSLALSLDPADGLCYNGLAAIAVSCGDQLEAVYNSYRAAIAGKPSPVAQSNLAREFEKMRERTKEDSYGLTDKSGEDLVDTLQKRFLAFHANSYTQPYDFVAFQQQANDICGMIALCFQETEHEVFDDFMAHAVLVNISAEALAKNGTVKPPGADTPDLEKASRDFDRSCQSYFLLQRFNLLLFQSLLKVLTREIGDLPTTDADLNDLSRLSPIVRRVLPHLRQYSSWFLSNMRDLVETRYKSSRKLLEQVARTYVSTLNLVRASVDVFAPSPIQHLLVEDERTISFTPFAAKVCDWRYLDGNTKTLKPPRPASTNGKPIAEEFAETHLRAIDLVVDALKLTVKKDELGLESVPVPVLLDNGIFTAREIPEAELPITPPSPPKQAWRRTHQSATSIGEVMPDSPSRPVSQHLPATPSSPLKEASKLNSKGNKRATAKDSQMQDVSTVSIRVAPEPAPSSTVKSSSVLTGTPAAATAQIPITGLDLVRQMQKSPSSPRVQRSPDVSGQYSPPVLPSVFQSAFTPTAKEQAKLSPRLATVQQRSPSFTAPENTSSAEMREYLARQAREISQRPTPATPWMPTMLTDSTNYGDTPTGLTSFIQNMDANQEHSASPLVSPFPTVNGRASQSKTSPAGSPYGVIGQARPVPQAPTSGQG